jgi:hypothetical protein
MHQKGRLEVVLHVQRHARVNPDPPITSADRRVGEFDLLRLRMVRALVLGRLFPQWLQVLMFAFLALLIAVTLGRFAPIGTSRSLFAKCNLGTLLIWGFWWPVVIWLTVLFGRVWCAVCPLEFVSTQTERLARRLGLQPRVLPRWLAAGGVALTLYILVQLLIGGLGVDRVPAYTALLMLGLLLVATAVGLIWRDRAFCRGFCPVGPLLATYGRGGMLALRRSCAGNCPHGSNHDVSKARNGVHTGANNCPSLLNPGKLNSNKDCLLCARCLKTAGSSHPLGLFWRRPFHPADARETYARWPITIFVMMESGFVVSELVEHWPAAERLFGLVPRWIWHQAGLLGYARYISWFWAMVIFPLALWLVIGAALRLLDSSVNLTRVWRRMALPVAVVISSAHMTNALVECNLGSGFLRYAFRDPIGFNTLSALANQMLPRPEPRLPPTAVSIAGGGLVVTGLIYAIREVKLTRARPHVAQLLPSLALASVFIVVVLGWNYVSR